MAEGEKKKEFWNGLQEKWRLKLDKLDVAQEATMSTRRSPSPWELGFEPSGLVEGVFVHGKWFGTRWS